MPLVAGTQLGPYEVIALIGAGGMGEVYRARDTRLKRDVALKVLPEVFAGDPDRLARFQREAEVLASLNHPNIAHIYGVEERALVMEFVQGETLSGPQPIETALDYGKQIAEALEYAHERGVIHRDLKPANLKVTPEGTIKVLDFGLAKAIEDPFVAPGDPTNSPTLTLGATRVGVIMGTAAYMSPEQASGKPADRRADIWSFGAVMYELLSGKRAFAGESVSDTLATVLKLDPDWTALPAGVPASIRHLLRRCLTKDRKQRLQAIGEARIALESPAQESPAAKSRRPLLAVSALAAVAILALAAVAFVHFRETPPAAPAMVRFPILLPEKGVRVPHLSVSPDGRWVVFGTTYNLWVYSMGSDEAKPLLGAENARGTPFWSTDSRTLVFGIPGKLRRIDIAGGPAQTVCDLAGELRGGFWTRDNRLVFGTTANGGLLQVPAGGGTPAPVTIADRGSHQDPVLLPDGRHFLYVHSGIEERGGIYLGSLDAPPTAQASKRLLADVSMPAYAPGWNGGGYVLFVREGALMAEAFDDRALAFTGEAVPVAEQVSAGSGQFSVSATGILVHAAGAGNFGRQLTWFDRQGKPGDSAWAPGQYSALALSPDATRVAVERNVSGPVEIWTFEFSRGASIRLTPGGGLQPAWSPDGSRIVYSSAAKGGLVAKTASGAGAEDLVLKSSHSVEAKDWSRDGRFLLYEDQDPKTKWDLWTIPMAGSPGEAKPMAFLNSEFNETDGKFSPDGRFIAYVSDESGRNEVYVSPFPESRGGKWPISNGGGYQPRWRRDGRELLYLAAGGRVMSVDVALSPAFQVAAPKLLFQASIYNGALTTRHMWDLTPDGKRFLINTVPVDMAAPLTVILNWQSALKK